MRALICIALVAAVYAGDKTWKEVKSCMEEKAQKCSEECKPSGERVGPFPIEKFITCMKETREKASENVKTCLKDASIDVDKLETQACWKPEDPDKVLAELKENAPAQGPPAIKKIIECAKECIAKTKCFDGCTGTEDKKVTEAIKTCMPKAFEAAKPIMKQCMKQSGDAGPPLPLP